MKDKEKNDQSNAASDIIDILAELIYTLVADTLVFSWKLISDSLSNNDGVKSLSLDNINDSTQSINSLALGYSTSQKKDLLFSDIDTGRHNLVVGASGFGKTTISENFIENDLRNHISVISFDPKGSTESIITLNSLCEFYGRKMYVFSEHYHTGDKFNLFKGLDTTQAVALIMRSFKWENGFYKTKSETALYQVIREVRERDEVLSFHTILKKLDEEEDKKSKEMIAGLISYLQGICFSSFGRLFDIKSNDEGYNISDIRGEGACLYIGLSTQGYGDIAKGIGKIFLCSLLFHSYEVLKERNSLNDKLLTNPISVHFDELGSILVEDFIDLKNKCREAKIRIYSYIQSLADIDAVSPFLKRQIFENSNNIFIQKQCSPDDVDFLSKSVSTIASKKLTKIIENGVEQNLGTTREAFQYVLHPSMFSRLKIGQCVLIRHDPKCVDIINVRYSKTSEALSTRKAPLTINDRVLIRETVDLYKSTQKTTNIDMFS
ncbi:hypothetical protein A9Q84_00250 [Halobacteriovorax marinus]|uniref:TraD/TraG TraM recognition site domain-containing protein n=1 Tax=Halobacteriovorax marinus TaxID=97084 RepID=A0A1Y5FDL5_9BACT|nr:hypothetical protein A9Q84_00250 [Halobacteriovorax marinus]